MHLPQLTRLITIPFEAAKKKKKEKKEIFNVETFFRPWVGK